MVVITEDMEETTEDIRQVDMVVDTADMVVVIADILQVGTVEEMEVARMAAVINTVMVLDGVMAVMVVITDGKIV